LTSILKDNFKCILLYLTSPFLANDLKVSAIPFYVSIVATLTLGSQPRQGLARVRAKREAQESHLMLPGV
jgi:hypothetical protein